MARIRSIKPEFTQSESVGRLSREARLLFIQLWTIADDEGRARAAWRLLASLLYPYDSDAAELIEGWLEELEREDCIVRYECNGNVYMQICKWAAHQKIDHPGPSRIPPFDESSRKFARDSRSLATDLGSRTLDLGSRTKDQNLFVSELKSSSDDEASREIERPHKTTPQTNHDAVRLAQLLKAEILRNKPDCKITQAQERNWTVTADRMIRLDHRTPDAIAALIQWVQHDEFWCPNVLSMNTLREKFDQLELRRQADSKPKKSRQDQVFEKFDREMADRRRDAVNS